MVTHFIDKPTLAVATFAASIQEGRAGPCGGQKEGQAAGLPLNVMQLPGLQPVGFARYLVEMTRYCVCFQNWLGFRMRRNAHTLSSFSSITSS